jgi:hypothetical protein
MSLGVPARTLFYQWGRGGGRSGEGGAAERRRSARVLEQEVFTHTHTYIKFYTAVHTAYTHGRTTTNPHTQHLSYESSNDEEGRREKEEGRRKKEERKREPEEGGREDLLL